MAQIKSKIKENPYENTYPTVFKKINQADVRINTFQANKTFEILSGSATSSALPLKGVYSDVNVLPMIGSELTYNDAKNVDDSLQTLTYFSINHLYYKNKTEPSKTFGPTNLNRTKKHLYESASILAIPQNKVGESVKPASFQFTSSVSGSFESDRYGNIVDSAFNTASIITDVKWNEGFNEYFDTNRITYQSAGVTYVDGIPTSNARQLPLGLSAYFTGSGYIQDTVSGEYNRNEDYAISFFISGANSGTTNQVVITKSTSSRTPQYPFRVELSGSNQLRFSAAGSTEFNAMITSSADVSSSWTHVVCQKTGSELQMYIDGTIHASASSILLEDIQSPYSASARIDNDHLLSIGGYSTSSFNLQGQLDEIRIYNKALTSNQVGYLADRTEGGTALQTQYVGNVFGKQGIVVFSSADYRVDDLLETPFTASYKSTVTMHELGVTTRLDAGDFNMSTNVTLTKDNNQTYRSFVSGSDFAPYVTSIGLYNDAGQLLAIGKLAQPIRKRNDVDINFLIRIDLDKKPIK
jgi:hypothetical protein